MPLTDYQDLIFRMQRGLARTWEDFPDLLNLPGRSVAFKLDMHYYLALQPDFDEFLARAAGIGPDRAARAMVRSGNYVTCPPEREHVAEVAVWIGGKVRRVAASFVDADFVDRSLKLYAGQPAGLSLADLKLAQDSRAVVKKLFAGKTPPGKLAWA